MEKSCQQSRCHQFYFPEPLLGRIRHSTEVELMGLTREGFRQWLAETSTPRPEACRANGISDCAAELAREMGAAKLFKGEGEDLYCGRCHAIAATGDAAVPWKVARLNVNRHWQPGAVFLHNKHATVACTDCHDKAGSESSADVSLPDIAKCRECHSGAQPAKGKVTSNCDTCHRFHRGVARAVAAR